MIGSQSSRDRKIVGGSPAKTNFMIDEEALIEGIMQGEINQIMSLIRAKPNKWI